MKTIEMSQLTKPVRDFMQKSRSKSLVFTRSGRPVAMLTNISNADQETLALSTNPRFLAMLRHSEASLKSKGGISFDEVCRRVGVTRQDLEEAKRRVKKLPED